MASQEFLSDGHLDGSVLAGPFADVFVHDVTVADTQCVHCGHEGPLARLLVYVGGPGIVARCEQCGQVMLRLVTTEGGAVHLDLRGTVRLTFNGPGPSLTEV
ncbi:DUF6510 family protein [Streptomyces tendae]|uniref:DUF6510 family protein n=1 Tax=Streptomyces tendae TaxID=1932 RepID=UPI003D711375